jgi:hypothetical protein
MMQSDAMHVLGERTACLSISSRTNSVGERGSKPKQRVRINRNNFIQQQASKCGNNPSDVHHVYPITPSGPSWQQMAVLRHPPQMTLWQLAAATNLDNNVAKKFQNT